MNRTERRELEKLNRKEDIHEKNLQILQQIKEGTLRQNKNKGINANLEYDEEN